MEEEKSLVDQIASETYDASERPFDYVEEGTDTALVCESDPLTRERITSALKENGYLVTEADASQDALRFMRFHQYQLIVINEVFDADTPSGNEVLAYLQNLVMSQRRYIFVVLVSGEYRTADNMAAFNQSVNMIINKANLDDAGSIIKRGVSEHEEFYRLFRDTAIKLGRY